MSESLARYEPAPVQAASGRLAAPIRVLHLFKYFRPDFTGDGLYFEKMFPHLARHGIHNAVAADRTRRPPGAIGNGVRLFGAGRIGLFNPRMLVWVAANAWRFDVVHFHSAVDRHFLYHLIARLSGARVVQSCTLDDGMGSVIDGYRPRHRGLVRRLCRLIDDVVAISPGLYADSLAVMRQGRVHLIPQGVAAIDPTPALRAAARLRFGFARSDTLLLFVGGLCARKDVRFLVRNHPPELGRLHLLLVGPVLDDAYAAALAHEIAASPAAGRIHLHGYMDDPSPAYAAADIFVFASRSEGFGNVLLEAMAHALPVVARRLPGITDSFIQHGATGVLFDTAAEYASAVRRLVAHPAERRALGAAARRSACTQFDLPSIASRYAGLYAAQRP